MKNFLEKEGAKNKDYEEYSDFDYYIDNYKRQFSNVLVISIEKLDKSPKRELRKISDFLGTRPWNFNLNVPRHETKDYKFGLLQYIRRYTYFFVVKVFYKFAAFTVKAKVKAQGEK